MHTRNLLTGWRGRGGVKSKRLFQDEATQIRKHDFLEFTPVSSGLGEGRKRRGEGRTLLVKSRMDPNIPNTKAKRSKREK